jgi:hypothetical protein
LIRKAADLRQRRKIRSVRLKASAGGLCHDLLPNRIQLVLASAVKQNRRAHSRKLARGSFADTVRRSGHQHNLLVNWFHVSSPLAAAFLH